MFSLPRKRIPDATSRGIGDYYEKVIVQERFFIQQNPIHYPDSPPRVWEIQKVQRCWYLCR